MYTVHLTYVLRFLFHFIVRNSDFYSLLQFYVGGLHKTEVIGMGGLENVVLQVKPMIPGSHQLITMRKKQAAEFNLLLLLPGNTADPIL